MIAHRLIAKFFNPVRGTGQRITLNIPLEYDVCRLIQDNLIPLQTHLQLFIGLSALCNIYQNTVKNGLAVPHDQLALVLNDKIISIPADHTVFDFLGVPVLHLAYHLKTGALKILRHDHTAEFIFKDCLHLISCVAEHL